jgi:hypothetical protein
MMTTMLGFLAAVCADATPLNANGSASAVVARNFLNIDVSFFFPEFEPINSAANVHIARTGPRATALRVQEEMLGRSAT